MAIKLLKSEKEAIVFEIIKQLNPKIRALYKKELDKEFKRLNNLREVQAFQSAGRKLLAKVTEVNNRDLAGMVKASWVLELADDVLETKGIGKLVSHRNSVSKRDVSQWLELKMVEWSRGTMKLTPKNIIAQAVSELSYDHKLNPVK